MGPYAKAIVAGLTALQAWLLLVFADESPGGATITAAELWPGLVGVALTTFGVWAFPNTPRSGRGSGGK